jgi:uncharacterized protein YuzE
MTPIRIGEYEFDSASYDARGDVLYLRRGERREPPSTFGTPEGHAVSFDESGRVIGMTIVNPKWLLERDGKVTITVPTVIESGHDELAALFEAPAV